MARLFCFLTGLMLAVLPVLAEDGKKSDGVELFAVASTSLGDKDLHLGDSVLVSVTLYSNVNFSQLKNKSDDIPKVKNARVRPFNRNRSLSQGVANYEGKRYYAVVAEQFVVAPEELGSLTFPALKYDVTLLVQRRSQSYDPFEDFFSFGSPFGHRSEKVSRQCVSEPLKIKVVKRPPQTIQDLRQKGLQLL